MLDITVCGFPPEYCEFSSSSTKCKAWLEKAHPALWSKYYSQGMIPISVSVLAHHSILSDALDSKMGALTVEAQAKLEADTAKKEAKAEAKAELAQKKKQVGGLIALCIVK